MIKLPPLIRESTGVLRASLVSFWLVSTLLLAAVLAGLDLMERHREVIQEGERMADLVQASLRSPMTSTQRQILIETYAEIPHLDNLNGVNVMLVVNASGKIVYTSRPAWRALQIDDSLIRRNETADSDFDAVIECFRERRPDCMTLQSPDLRLRTGSFTVVRPVQRPAVDLGLPREPFLVLVNFDAGVVLADLSQDLLVLGLIAVLLSSVLSFGLWLLLATRLLPSLSEASQTDGLTRLMNRTSFMEIAMDILLDAEESGRDFVFSILDIDHFKKINDTYGHDCGDVALVSVASILSTVLRPDDLVCRFGGEEFALLLAADRASGMKILERLRLQLEMSRIDYNGHQVVITVSIGAAATRDCGYNLDYLYTSADKALYSAKTGGRNRAEWSNVEPASFLQISR